MRPDEVPLSVRLDSDGDGFAERRENVVATQTPVRVVTPRNSSALFADP